MKQLFVVTVAIAVCLLGFGNDVTGLLPEEEIVAIKAFFKEFKDALNSNDVEQVKRMSGQNWDVWSRWIGGMDKLEDIEVLCVSGGPDVEVVARVSIDGEKRRVDEGVFVLKKSGQDYAILSSDSKRNIELSAASESLKGLTEAIKAKDKDAVRAVLSFGNVEGFGAELTAHGLLWISAAVDSPVGIDFGHVDVIRENDGGLIGRVEVISSPDGAKVLREVYFDGAKIDRAAPSELERLEERRKQRAMQQSEDDCKSSETEMTEIIRKRFFKRIKQNRKNKEPSK